MTNPPKGTIETAILVLLNLSRGAESRKKIMVALLTGPKNCNQLSKETDLDWWTVKRHLLSLTKENLVKSSDFEKSKFYKLTPNGENALNAVISNNPNEERQL